MFQIIKNLKISVQAVFKIINNSKICVQAVFKIINNWKISAQALFQIIKNFKICVQAGLKLPDHGGGGGPRGGGVQAPQGEGQVSALEQDIYSIFHGPNSNIYGTIQCGGPI